jgi:hypothetical protein
VGAQCASAGPRPVVVRLLCGIQNRTFGPYLAAMHRVLIPVLPLACHLAMRCSLTLCRVHSGLPSARRSAVATLRPSRRPLRQSRIQSRNDSSRRCRPAMCPNHTRACPLGVRLCVRRVARPLSCLMPAPSRFHVHQAQAASQPGPSAWQSAHFPAAPSRSRRRPSEEAVCLNFRHPAGGRV